MIRTAILVDDFDKRVGKCQVPDSVMLIQHADAIYVRTDTALRLSGGGVGIKFRLEDPVVRNKLESA